jgi:hypothetical protein
MAPGKCPDPVITPTVSCVFTLMELWLLHDCVRDECWFESDWKTPPSSPELNAEITEAILLCERYGLKEAAVQLSERDCLVIDRCVPRWRRSKRGKPIGKRVLLKSFAARHTLRHGSPLPDAAEFRDLSRDEVVERLKQRRDAQE